MRHMRNKKSTTDSRPLVVRILTTFLAIWIALSASQCVSDYPTGNSANADSSPAQNEQPADTTADGKDPSGKTSDGKNSDDKNGSASSAEETDPTNNSDEPGGDDPNSESDRTSDGQPTDLAGNFTVPAYAGNPSVQVNGNKPSFDSELIAKAEGGSFENYRPLDSLGRATGAMVCAGLDTMPEGERGSIGDVRPTGFHLTRYDWVDGKYLYNRCHLIGWQLTGENSNTRNLITGTRSMNVEGMLPYENQIDDYIESTGNHVLYRATPVYEGGDLVARGVLLEARSVEDDGRGLSFCVFCFNVEPGVTIDYATGASAADGTMQEEDLVDETKFNYILNTNTKRIHEPSCPSVDDMKEKNKQGFNGTVEEAEAKGYVPCGRCKP